jgi:hypothetical protein
MRNAPFTEQSIKAMLDHLGVNVQGRRSASAMSRASRSPRTSPPLSGRFAHRRQHFLDRDATSLRGGTLLMTPMMAADGLTYAVAQGSIAVSGFVAGAGRIGQRRRCDRWPHSQRRPGRALGARRSQPGQPLVLELATPTSPPP